MFKLNYRERVFGTHCEKAKHAIFLKENRRKKFKKGGDT